MRTRRHPDIRRTANGHPNLAADDAAKVLRKDRRHKVLQLRVAGNEWLPISKELGISTKQCKRDFDRALSEHGAETVDQCRDVLARRHANDIRRLELGILAVMPKVAASPPDIAAARTLALLTRAKTSVQVALAKLMGANKPEHVVLDHSGGIEIHGGDPADSILGRLAGLASAVREDPDSPEPVTH